MTDTSKHTGAPWRAQIAERSDGEVTVAHITSADGIAIAQMAMHDNVRANAAFIVRACNAHEELVKALRAANEKLWKEGFTTADETIAQIEAALSKAGGGQ